MRTGNLIVQMSKVFKLVLLSSFLLVPAEARAGYNLEDYRPAPEEMIPTFQVQFKNDITDMETFQRSKTYWFPIVELSEFIGSQAGLRRAIRLEDFAKVGEQLILHIGEDRVVTVNLKTSTVDVFRDNGTFSTNLPQNVQFRNGVLYVSFEDLSVVFDNTFLFRLDGSTLYVEENPVFQDYWSVAVRAKSFREDVWVSLKDAAEAAGAIVYNSGGNEWSLVLPDFSIRKITPGNTEVKEEDETVLNLPVAPELIDAEIYVTLPSANLLFDLPFEWDEKEGRLILPIVTPYGAVPVPSEPGSGQRVEGRATARAPAAPKAPRPPLRFNVNELDVYYQKPPAVFSSDPTDPESSVLDSFTDKPSDRSHELEKDAFNHLSGRASVGLQGNAGFLPVNGYGTFERVNDKEKVTSASLRLGGKALYVQGGKDWFNLNGLSGQQTLATYGAVGSRVNVPLSRTNDPLNLGFDAMMGEHEFSAFLSTSTFFETQGYRQRFFGGTGFLRFPVGKTVSATLRGGAYKFENEIVSLTREQIQDPTLESGVIESTGSVLAQASLTDHHEMAIGGLTLDHNHLTLAGDVGMSQFKNPGDVKFIRDSDWKGRAILKWGRSSRVDMSYESVGPEYRSLGNPLLYQDHVIQRVAPYWHARRNLWIYGEYRTETFKINDDDFRQEFSQAGVKLKFGRNTYTTSASLVRDDLSGIRRIGAFDYLRQRGYFTWGLGGEYRYYTDIQDRHFQSTTVGNGTVTYSWKENHKLSFNQQVFRNDYIYLGDERRWESISSLTADVGKIRGLFRYSTQPRARNISVKENILYTALGYTLKSNRIVSVYYSASSAEYNMSNPTVWRAGMKLSYSLW